jgi:hypothetical protein
MQQRPYFLWDEKMTDSQLREKLKSNDPDTRAQWQGWILAEARYDDVWRYLSVEEILRDWAYIQRHLGRKKAFWNFLLQGWRDLGLIPN